MGERVRCSRGWNRHGLRDAPPSEIHPVVISQETGTEWGVGRQLEKSARDLAHLFVTRAASPSPLCAGQPRDSWAVHIGGGALVVGSMVVSLPLFTDVANRQNWGFLEFCSRCGHLVDALQLVDGGRCGCAGLLWRQRAAADQ